MNANTGNGDPRREDPMDDAQMRELFSAVVGRPPTYEDTTSVAAHKGRRIRRRRQVTAVAGGLAFAAVVAVTVPALLSDDMVSTRTPDVAARSTEPVPNVSPRPTLSQPSRAVVAPTVSGRTTTRPSPAPQPSRPVYCGTITDIDTAGARVTLRAETSYLMAGDIYDARSENVTFTLPVSDDVEVNEFTQPKGMNTVASGDLAERLAVAERLSGGDKRPYLDIRDGTVTRISFGVNTGEPSTPDCFDDR